MKFTGTTRFAAFALLVVSAATYMSSCKDDIFLPDPRGLLGSYSGVLIVQDFTATPPTSDTDHVIFSLSFVGDSTYKHNFDKTWKDSGDVSDICDVDKGKWTIVNSKIALEVIQEGTGEVCNSLLIPAGLNFGFRPLSVENVGDSLNITQRIQDSENQTTKLSTFRLTLDEAF